ncbi:hypothetical protein [Acetobacter sp.]|uniref:hypothetical protein n=1 Tax=Acetobacter sp. TaxID=440 RepID=UPI0039EA6914
MAHSGTSRFAVVGSEFFFDSSENPDNDAERLGLIEQVLEISFDRIALLADIGEQL